MAPIELEIQSDSEVESVADDSYEEEDSSVEEDLYAAQKKDEAGNNPVKDITRDDSNFVFLWKMLVLFLMAALTSCVSAGAYYFLKDEENKDYYDSVSGWEGRVFLRRVCFVYFSACIIHLTRLSCDVASGTMTTTTFPCYFNSTICLQSPFETQLTFMCRILTMAFEQ